MFIFPGATLWLQCKSIRSKCTGEECHTCNTPKSQFIENCRYDRNTTVYKLCRIVHVLVTIWMSYLTVYDDHPVQQY